MGTRTCIAYSDARDAEADGFSERLVARYFDDDFAAVLWFDRSTANRPLEVGGRPASHAGIDGRNTGSTLTSIAKRSRAALHSPYGFLMLDRDGAAGLDTRYVADDHLDHVAKLEVSAGSWVSRGGVFVHNPRGLTGRVGPNGVELFVTQNEVGL